MYKCRPTGTALSGSTTRRARLGKIAWSCPARIKAYSDQSLRAEVTCILKARSTVLRLEKVFWASSSCSTVANFQLHFLKLQQL